MKKFLVFLLVAACVCASCLTKVEANPLFSFEKVSRVCFVADAQFDSGQCERSGDLFFNYYSTEEAEEKISTLKEKSIAIQFEFCDADLDEVLCLLKATVILQSALYDETDQESENSDGDGEAGAESGDEVVIVGWSPYGDDYFYVDGKKANFQLAAFEDKIVVGLPAIYTSF